MQITPEAPPTPPRDKSAWENKLHRTPPPDYHRYSNDSVFPGAPWDISGATRKQTSVEEDYLDMGSPSKSSAGSPSKWSNRSPPPSFDEAMEEHFPKAGVTAMLPSQRRHDQGSPLRSPQPLPQFGGRSLNKLFSRSCEDLSEHMRRSIRMKATNLYVYNNHTFQMSEEAVVTDTDEVDQGVYSYATTHEMAGATAHFESSTVPRRVQMRNKPAPPTNIRYAELDRKSLRKSMSNPNMLDSHSFRVHGTPDAQPMAGGPPMLKKKPGRPNLPLNLSFQRQRSDERSILDKSLSPSTPLTQKTPNLASPISLPGINKTQHTRTFKKQKNPDSPQTEPVPTTRPAGKIAANQSAPRKASNGSDRSEMVENKENHMHETLC